jgi:dipeptidyl aminopeptidase/acylaminoacyl peptidase
MSASSTWTSGLVPFGFALATVLPGEAAWAAEYQKPPRAILEALHTPRLPEVLPSPTGEYLLLYQREQYPPVAELTRPYLKLAGQRIDPATNGPHAPPRIVELRLLRLAEGRERVLPVPAAPRLSVPLWSPRGDYLAFSHTTNEGIELWLAEVAQGRCRRLPGVRLNAAYGTPFRWLPDGRTLLCQVLPANRGQPPAPPPAPRGPIIQESQGRHATVRTYQDLLRTPYDADLFDYYATSQLVLVDIMQEQITPLGAPGIFRLAVPSPDGRYFLVVRLHRPYSYWVPASAFPQEVEVWDRSGRRVHRLASLPLAEEVPIEGVPAGPRLWHWLPTAPATLVWVEALDGGDPRRQVPQRDRLLLQTAPFTSPPQEWFRTAERCVGLLWGEKEGTVLVREYDRRRRWLRTWLCEATPSQSAAKLLDDRSLHDHYHDPGEPATRTLPTGAQVFCWRQGRIFLLGRGASPQGERPFLDEWDLNTRQKRRLFQCPEGRYEKVVALLADDPPRWLTCRESPAEPPNYWLHQLGQAPRQLTHFTDPAPLLRRIRRQLVSYLRDDGVPLSFTLYLPPDYQPGQKRPALMWAYPREYVDRDTAGQVTGSPLRFLSLSGPSHLFLLLEGYVILDQVAMPVVGDPDTVNNTYLEQIVSNARAALRKAEELGVLDPKRVAVGGHSYGAFMAVNLLAHCDLFRAGIARSGAYNRTLTPFGFQNERRTLWEAPELYVRVSPLFYAHRIKAPLLLLHGAEDDNPGTFPLQSERLYHALQGNGGTVRLVLLPGEAHGYVARESVEHTLYEMSRWLERYLR